MLHGSLTSTLAALKAVNSEGPENLIAKVGHIYCLYIDVLLHHF